MSVKQVIVIRKDLNMRRGKEIAQGAHAACMFLRQHALGVIRYGDSLQLSEVEQEWLEENFAKITLQVIGEDALIDIAVKAEMAGIVCHIVTDAGLTEFNGVPTKTCLALGPDTSEAIDKITGDLRLY